MKDTKRIIALGVLVAIVPFLGFPSAWKNVIFATLGLAIAVLAYRILISNRPVVHEDEDVYSEQQSVEHMEAVAAHE